MENPIVALARVLGATRVTQRIGRDLYDRQRPDLMAIYFEGTDEVGHVFAPFTPPRTDCASVPEADVAKYRRVVETYYAAVDRMLGQWMRRAQEDGATVLVHSDHGFKWSTDRPCGLASGSWSTAAFWHRKEGVLAAWGKGVAPSRERAKASLFDVAPTVLALARTFPPIAGCRGRSLKAAFSDCRRFETEQDLPVSSCGAWRPRRCRRRNERVRKKLLALGYLSPGEAPPLRRPAATGRG